MEQKSSSHILPPKDANALSARQQNTELIFWVSFLTRVKFLKVDTSMAQKKKKKYKNTSLLN